MSNKKVKLKSVERNVRSVTRAKRKNPKKSVKKQDSSIKRIDGIDLEEVNKKRIEEAKKANGYDEIELKDGIRKISSLLKEYHLPYAIVLENSGIVEAVFLSFLGGRDRLSNKLLNKEGIIVSVTQ